MAGKWDTPEWFAFRREATLASELIGTGVTALGRANYVSGKGEYYNAFFGLSIGVERLAKLILVVDHMLDHSGTVPSMTEIKKYGHDLGKLLNRVDGIASNRGLKLEYNRPNDIIADAVIDCLDNFADAKKGRYANLEALGNPNFGGEFEPIRKYWEEVAELILERHYHGTKVESRVKAKARGDKRLIKGNLFIGFFNETGNLISNTTGAFEQNSQTEVVQKWGRFYTLVTVRWLADVYSILVETACMSQGIDSLFRSGGLFLTYRVKDKTLRTRKRWPLKLRRLYVQTHRSRV